MYIYIYICIIYTYNIILIQSISLFRFYGALRCKTWKEPWSVTSVTYLLLRCCQVQSMIGGCSQSRLTMIYRHLEITYASFAKVNLSTESTVPSWLQNPQGLPKASLSRTTGQDSTALLRWTWIPGCSNTLYTILSILAHIFPPWGFYVINVHQSLSSSSFTVDHGKPPRLRTYRVLLRQIPQLGLLPVPGSVLREIGALGDEPQKLLWWG